MAAVSAPNTWQSVKEKATALFQSKKYGEAIDEYSEAIKILQSDSSPNATASDNAKQLAILESNIAAAHFQLGAYESCLAASDRSLHHDSTFLKARLRKAHALEKLAATSANASLSAQATHDQVQRLQQAIMLVQQIKQAMSAATPATANQASSSSAAPAVSSLPNVTEVNNTLQRLRNSLSQLHATLTSPLTFINALRNHTSASIVSDIRSAMQLIVHSATARDEAFANGFVPLLLQYICDKDQSHAVHAAATRALRHLLSTDLASGSTSSLELEPLRAQVPTLLHLLAFLHQTVLTQQQLVPPPLPTALSQLRAFITALMSCLARIAAHPRLNHAFTLPIALALKALLPVDSNSASSSSTSHPPTSLDKTFWTPTMTRCIQTSIESITYICASPFLPPPMLRDIRQAWMPLLLFAPSAQVAHEGVVVGAFQLRSSILAAVAIMTKAAASTKANPSSASSAAAAALNALNPLMQKTFGKSFPGIPGLNGGGDGELTEEQQKALEEEAMFIKNECLHWIYRPLIGEDAAPAASALTPTSSITHMEVKLNFKQTISLIRGLSLLIQANTVLGIFVVSYGEAKEKADTAAKNPATASTDSEKEEQKQKEKADTRAAEATPQSQQQPPAQQTPTVLQLLLSLSSYISPIYLSSLPQTFSSSGNAVATPPKLLQLLAAEVLALSSSDAIIRQTIVQLSRTSLEQAKADADELRSEGIEPGNVDLGKGADVFLDLIIQYTDLKPDSSGSLASASAALASSSSATSSGNTTTIPNEQIVAHAILALSKLIAVGDWGEDVSKPEDAPPADPEMPNATPPLPDVVLSQNSQQEFALLLHILSKLIERYESFIPRGEKDAEREARVAARKASRAAAKQKNENIEDEEGEDEDIETNEDLFAESARLQHLSLLHLCFESLSYLSLHSFAKKWIVCDSNSNTLKLLMRIASGVAPPQSSAGANAPAGASLNLHGPVSDATMRYAIIFTVKNLLTSRESLSKSHNAEVEQLKQLASRGLSNSGTSAGLNEAQNARAKSLAGSEKLISVLSNILVKQNVVKALAELFKGYVIQSQEKESNSSKLSTSSSSSTSAATAAPVISANIGNALSFCLLQLSTVKENRGLIVQQGGIRLMLDLYALSAKPPSPTLGITSPASVLQQSEENASLNSPQSPYRASQDSLISLARTLISINPTLLQETHIASCIHVLLEGLEIVEHDLYAFEIMMALTNLASFDNGSGGPSAADIICTGSKKVTLAPDPRDTWKEKNQKASVEELKEGEDKAESTPTSAGKVVQLNGWTLAKSQLVSNNPLVQRASVELMTNLVNSEYVRTKIRNIPAEIEAASGKKIKEVEFEASYNQTLKGDLSENEDLRLMLVFAMSEDLPTQLAATGALAMLSNDPLIVRRICATRIVSFVPIDDAESSEIDPATLPAEQRSDINQPPDGHKVLIRTGLGVVQRLTNDRQVNPDVKVRIDVLRKHIQEQGISIKK